MRFFVRDRVLEADAATVEQLTRTSGFFRDDEVEIAKELVEERLRDGSESGYHFLFVGEDRAECVGYACYGPSVTMAGWHDLYWIVVDKARRGRGIGGMILDEVERRVRREGGLGLIVETSGSDLYVPTRAFYEGLGFMRQRTHRDRYGPGDDMVVYVKSLEGRAKATGQGCGGSPAVAAQAGVQ